MTAPACTIDVLTGRVWYDGAVVPRRIIQPAPGERCAWEGCTEPREQHRKYPCPEFCRRHCIEAEHAGYHVCARTRQRERNRRSDAKQRWAERHSGSLVLREAAGVGG